MTGRRDKSEPTQRQLRVGEELRHALAHVLARETLHDAALAGRSITVSEVRVSPDLKQATVFVAPLGAIGEEAGMTAEVVAGLNRVQPFLRGAVARRVKLRSMPRFSFLADEGFDHANRIDAVLRRPEVARDLGGPGGGADDTGTA